jgi:apolipoprotein N-acyltransferase
MKALSRYDFDYSVEAGERQTRFPQTASGKDRLFHFGVLICYEDTDPTLARRMALEEDDQPAADFLVNISNDGWFDGSSEHEEHLAICRFRAIETRRAVIRSVNMGISGVIDGSGRVFGPQTDRVSEGVHLWDLGNGESELSPSQWHNFKKVQGVLIATVPIDNRGSLYALWGDWLPMVCWVLVFLGLFACWFKLAGISRPLVRTA